LPSFTYIASANAVEATGAEVVFCDIDIKTFNIDVSSLEKLVQSDKAIRAVMPVHLFGLCANMPVILKLAQEYGFKIVEDAACGFGSRIGTDHSGTFGDFGCFSFHPRKVITTGEGGMVLTQNKALFDIVSQLADHGAEKTDLQRHNEKGGSLLPNFSRRGFNYRMTDFQGAVGVCQMRKCNKILSSRLKIANKYDQALGNIEQLNTPFVPDGYQHGYQSYVCLYTNGEEISNLSIDQIDRLNFKRNQLMLYLEKEGIATRQGTHAVHTLDYYKKKYCFKDESFLNSYAADRLSIAFPLYAEMTDAEFDYVVNKLKLFLQEEVMA